MKIEFKIERTTAKRARFKVYSTDTVNTRAVPGQPRAGFRERHEARAFL